MLCPAFILNYFRYVYIAWRKLIYHTSRVSAKQIFEQKCWRPPNSIFYVSPRILEVHKHISSLEVFCYRFFFVPSNKLRTKINSTKREYDKKSQRRNSHSNFIIFIQNNSSYAMYFWTTIKRFCLLLIIALTKICCVVTLDNDTKQGLV